MAFIYTDRHKRTDFLSFQAAARSDVQSSVDDPSCTFAVSDVQDLNIIRNKSIGKLCEKLSLSFHTKTYESVVKWKLTFTFCIFYKERAVLE